MPRLLVVSFASLNQPHRAPYDRLGREPGWEVHVAAPARVRFGEGVKACDGRPEGAAYALHPLPLALPDSGRLIWFRGLSRLVARLRPDVIFAEYDPGSLPVVHAYLASRPWRSRVFAFTVENIHRDRWADARGHAAALRWRDAARDALVAGLGAAGEVASAGLACINQEGARIYRGPLGWRKPLTVMPLGTDTALFRPMDAAPLRRSLGLEGGFVIGYFGRLTPDKGVHLLIEALALLPPAFRLLLDMFTNFAPGSYAASLLDRARALGVRDRVVTIDVPHARVPEHMSCCDALVLPSLSTPRWKEQFGRVLPEAMACGVPVIGAASGNIPDMIGDAGLLVPEGDAAAIAAAARRIADEPALRERLRRAGRERVEALFSVEVQVRKMKELFLSA